MFTAVVPGSVLAGGSAIGELKSNAPLFALENVSFETPIAARDSSGELSKFKAAAGVEGATPYEVLKNLFKTGSPATEKDLTGWYSGRVVFQASPDRLQGGLIIGKRVPVISDGGPLFQDKTEFRVGAFTIFDPGFYDKRNSEIAKEENRQMDSGRYSVILFPAAEAIHEVPGRGKDILQYRKTGNYILEHWAGYDQDGKTMHEAYSYYFLNVTPA